PSSQVPASSRPSWPLTSWPLISLQLPSWQGPASSPPSSRVPASWPVSFRAAFRYRFLADLAAFLTGALLADAFLVAVFLADPFSTVLKAVAGENFTPFEAAIFTGAPVCGFRPMRAAREVG